ncbi:hypothetical protein ABZW67_06125 [Streptomyces rubiginosohelvolus]|uniref:hypothetical protein n=1 Tax=Streptomyces rubiginosohelvolus TaxID=67362 RepID=UPI00339FC90B
MGWSGHWHGYGPWIGSRDAYGEEGLRRPGAELNSENTRAFLASSLPPLMTAHWLMKRNQISADRTWMDMGVALAWLTKAYEENPPFTRPDGLESYISLEAKLEYATDVLPLGVDVSWVYYTGSRSLISFSVVCCPNRLHPNIPCPLPPS